MSEAGEREPSGEDGHEGLEPGTVLDEKFRIERLLGHGGMGAVYEVTHELTRHRRALKLLHAPRVGRKHAVERFLREASAAGRIGSPHIVETFDAGRLTTGEPYLVMELLDGITLGERIKQAPAGLPLVETASILGQVCEGVQAAHDAGIVHRDLKPDNIFLIRRGVGWHVKVLDFGVSKFDPRYKGSSLETKAGAFMGTPAYMSPEQFEDASDVDGRADVYALGVILYQSLTGSHPYPARGLPELAHKIATAAIVPVCGIRPDLPATIDALLEQAMRKDRRARTLSAAMLGERLRGIGEQAAALAVGDTLEASPSAMSTASKAQDASPLRAAPEPSRATAVEGRPPGVATEDAGTAEIAPPTLDEPLPLARRSPGAILLALIALVAVGGAIWWSQRGDAADDHAAATVLAPAATTATAPSTATSRVATAAPPGSTTAPGTAAPPASTAAPLPPRTARPPKGKEDGLARDLPDDPP
jgi:eukaryotic-like serine/threonine-protein kinase